ncbi:uncharacterized protein LOC112045942 [Bicyclus anynana]|uniref:Uncharacterized protein LOC112045942 n=1 Tax=Bicyclus anynana TaxID=110368 RepID=A0ABM3LVK9_BICAN|nr:uncharacterized protein LOC112045942 [Bicyclus anynana]
MDSISCKTEQVDFEDQTDAKQELNTDSEYNSSDFEFIDEDQAYVSNFKITDETEACTSTLKRKLDLNTLYFNCKEHLTNNFDEDLIISDYFKSLQPAIINNYDTSYRDSHRIPNEEEYLDLFGENFAPYPLRIFENKSIGFVTRTKMHCGGVGFDMEIDEENITPEERKEAKESAQLINSMYPVENIRRHSRRTR